MPETVIDSLEVANQLNAWYLAFQAADQERCRQLKVIIDRMMTQMTENQDVLLYYSLLSFLMQVNQDSNREDALFDTPDPGLTHTIDYYFALFSGMYAFKKRAFLKAIHHYMDAEKRVLLLHDTVEEAHCYYRISQAYGALRYSFLAITYAEKSLALIGDNPNFYRYQIFCKMVIANCYLNERHWSKALPLYEKIQSCTQAHHDTMLDAISTYNIGLVHLGKKEYFKAEQVFQTVVQRFQEMNSRYLPKAWCGYLEACVMQKKRESAAHCFEAAIQSAQRWQDTAYIAKCKVIYEFLPNAGNLVTIGHAFHTLVHFRHFSWVCDYALLAAHYFHAQGNDHDAMICVHWYERALEKLGEAESLDEG
ncbi:MAG: hypothetical protein ABF586_05055 [Sporolactobacillus sp.]